MNSHIYCVIMAGGAGTRFWPISRSGRPKQFLDILGTGKTFIRSTFERFAEFVPAENFLVVTNSTYRDLVLEQLPEIAPQQILAEPLGRNTAPCIAYAAFRLKATAPDSTMIVTPSDHLILNEPAFRNVVEEAVEFASSHEALVTIGVQPTRSGDRLRLHTGRPAHAPGRSEQGEDLHRKAQSGIGQKPSSGRENFSGIQEYSSGRPARYWSP